MACRQRQESSSKTRSTCTTGKVERIWALYGRGEVLSTWMRLLYPAEAAHPSPNNLLSTPDLLSLCLSPHNLMFQGLLLGSYAREGHRILRVPVGGRQQEHHGQQHHQRTPGGPQP